MIEVAQAGETVLNVGLAYLFILVIAREERREVAKQVAEELAKDEDETTK